MAKEQTKQFLDTISALPLGTNSGLSPLLLPLEQTNFSLNTTFRGGYATERPPSLKRVLDFGGDQALETAVRKGFFQGAGVYRPDFGPSQILAQISGRLFAFTEIGTLWMVKDISVPGDPNDASTTQVWMEQGEKWMLISDGSGKLPIIYDGITSRRSYGPSVVLGNVIATSAANPSLTPIGSTMTWTLSAAYSGPFNVPVLFNGAFYQPITNASPTPVYNAVLENVFAPVGSTVAAGQPILVVPGNIGYLVTNNTSTIAAPWNNFTATMSDTSGLNVNDVVTIVINGPIFLGPFNWKVTSVNHATNVVSLIVVGGFSFGSSPGNVFIQDGTIVTRTTALPNVIVGNVQSAFVNPAFGGSVTVQISAPYTGIPGQIVWIGTSQYKISPAAPPAPSSTITVINLSDVGTSPYVLPQDFLSVPEIPACRMVVYGLGQFWFSLTDGLQFGCSDVVRSSAGTQANDYRDAILKTSNLNIMGNFAVPVAGEIITAMRFVATLDVSLGQGPLQIGVASGFFSCKAPFDLVDWAALSDPSASPILTKSLIGSGPVGQNSTILANSDTIFRSFDGVDSLIIARRGFSDVGGNTPISREMTRTIVQDNKTLLSYSSAIMFDNRLRMTCHPVASGQGVFHEGELVLNYDLISSLRGKASPVWDGLWTGTNIFQYVQGLFGPVSRAFAFTFNITDTQIELVEFLPTGNQHFDNGDTRIIWQLESASLFNQNVKDLKELVRLADGEIQVDEVVGRVDFEAWWKPDQYPCWVPWHKWSVCATEKTADNPDLKPGFYPRMGLGEPDDNLCDEFTGRSFTTFYTMQFKLVVTGQCRLISARFKADHEPQQEFAPPICNTDCVEVPNG